MDIFLRLDSALSGVIFFALMLIGWWLGNRIRLKRGADLEASTRIEDAGLALFGLLLAFCFSGAVGRYENRKALTREEAIAIGDFVTVAGGLKTVLGNEIKQKVIEYTRQRLVSYDLRMDNPLFANAIRKGRQLHGEIFSIVKKVVAENNTPTLHTPLMNGFNGLTKAHDQRYYAAFDQVPGGIVLLLVLFGFYSAFTIGRLSTNVETRSHKASASLTAQAMLYSILVSLVFTTTIDLEQPQRGFLTVSRTPMTDLLHSLE